MRIQIAHEEIRQKSESKIFSAIEKSNKPEVIINFHLSSISITTAEINSFIHE
ncbi:hypothetical protein [Acidianus manzaensis]|uniref:hypothetical protein n=1 Tax=Acidianus manzaensis TaxID=282676 RepID=UPI0016508D66|nr:hypothetical protein [Acidianus manzaensis]